MLKNIVAVLGLIVVVVGGALIIQKGGKNLSQVPPAGQVAQVATDGLLGYWKLDDASGSSAADSSANGYSASVSGATWTTGKIGGGLQFASSNSAKVSNKASYSGMSNVTISGWVRLDSTGTQYIVGKEHSAAPYTSYYLYTDSANHLNFTVNTSSGSANAYSSTVLSTGVWYHIAGVYDGSKATVYVNGAASGSANASGNIISSDGPFSMNISFFKGTLDEVRLYSRALSASEVSTLADPSATSGGTGSGTTGGTTPPPVTQDTTPPVVSAINVASQTGTRGSSATITWTTDEPANSYIEYGITTAYGSNTALDTSLTTSHSQSIAGLAANTVYNYRITSTDASKNTATSLNQTFTTPSIQTSPDTLPPSDPSSLSASAVSTSQINLSWTASTDLVISAGTVNSGMAGYKIFRNGAQVGTSATNSYSDSGLTAATTYSYAVSAYDNAGNASAQSASVSATTKSASVIGKFNVGDRVKVTSDIRVRTSPNSDNGSNYVTGNNVQKANATGTVMLAPSPYTSPTKDANGNIWSYVKYADGTIGWSTEAYLTLAPVQYSVTVTKTGTGTGVVKSGGSINCGTVCTSSGDAGSTVTLTATPDATPAPGSVFTLWSGVNGCSTSATCTFTLNGNTTVSAVFTKLVVVNDNPPVVSAFSIPLTSTSLTVPITAFTATDDNRVAGYLITESATAPSVTAAGWSTSVPTSYTFATAGVKTLYAWAKDDKPQVSAAKTAAVTVTTVPTVFSVTVTKTGSGTINSTPSGIDCAGGIVCTLANVAAGTPVTLTATPSTGYAFAGWGGACTGTGSCTVSAAANITATFKALSIKFSVDDVIKVTGTAPGYLNIRSTPSATGSVAGTAVDGTKGTVASGGTRYADSINWWNVVINAITGWASEDYLVKDTSTPTVPTAALSASPSTITSGQSSTLTWSSTNATSCTGSWSTATLAASGSATVKPTQTTTYTVSCRNADGVSDPASARVNVGTASEFQIPSARTTEWTPGTTVGVNGGVPNSDDTKYRKTIYTTLSPGATADQIANAFNLCPAGQVVYLNAGTYNLSSQIRILNKSDCTLRGAGPGNTILKTSAWAALLNIGQFPWITEWPADTAITGGGTKGSTSITVGSTAGMSANTLVYLEEDNITNEIYGFGSGSANSAGRMRDGKKVSAQIVKVSSVSGNTVTFTPPLNFDFPSSRNPRAVAFNKQGVQNVGIEDLTIAGSTGGYGIWWQGSANSWMKNVEVTAWDTFGIEIQYSTNMEVRDTYVHDPNTFNWSKGYSLQLDQANNVLIENNTFYKYQDGILFQGTSAGNVVAYNTLFRSYPAYNGITVQLASLFGNHTPLPTKNLYEGNYAPSFHSDYYYGPSSDTTLLRNYFPGADVEALQNRIAVNIDSHQWNYSVVGNIIGQRMANPPIYLGLPKTTLTYANPSGITDWQYATSSTDNFSYSANKIYRLGYPYIGNNSSSGVSSYSTAPTEGNLGQLDATVKPGGSHETILHGNWDGATNGIRYMAGAENKTIVQDSAYLSGKPSWWPTALRWPPFDATTYSPTASTTEKMLLSLPSGIRLVTGTMPGKNYIPPSN